MTPGAKMMMMRSNRRKRDYGMRNNMNYPMTDNYGVRNDMESRYDMDSRFRDRRGREHYDNGRYAPRSEWEARIVGNHYEDDMESRYYPAENREMPRRMDRGGNSGARGDMARMNRIGFDTGQEIRSDYGSRLDAPVWNEGSGMNGSVMHHGRSMASGGFDEKTAEEWMEGLKNADGSSGPHWTREQVKSVISQKSIDCDPVELWVAMNMFYSDYCKVAKKMNVNNVNFYLDMAMAFLQDEDAVEDKLSAYYENVVRHK